MENHTPTEEIGCMKVQEPHKANLLESAVTTSLNSLASLESDFQEELQQIRKALSVHYSLRLNCLDKLTEAAMETRDELLQKKESQMKNLHLLAGALNGIANGEGSSVQKNHNV